ncbi:MAG: diiron oxygenase [Gammaproteobacteria bacterium]|nr:diiron oxygenase [Gammaproteobacteria bacterium]
MDSNHSLLLKKLTASWSKRAQVKKEELLPFWEEKHEDFISALLPFSHSAHYQALSPSVKSKILTCGWLLYNFKTIQIESKIVMGSCLDIIKEGSSVTDNEAILLLATETLTDEAYHIYLIIKANQFTEQKRGFKINPPLFNLILEKNKLQNNATESWQKILINLVFAIVSEVYIGDYLDVLSHSNQIQPFNQMVTMLHRKDELAHRKIFKEIAKNIFNKLNLKQKNYFSKIFPLPLKWFFDREMEAWESALLQIKCKDFKKLIFDAKSMLEPARDYTQIISLAEEIGILESQVGKDAFHSEKII